MWFTERMTDLETMPQTTTRVDVDTDETTETGEPTSAHIVKTKTGRRRRCRARSTHHGHARRGAVRLRVHCVKDPKQLPLCDECKSVYQMYKAFNDGLHDTPND